MKKQTKFLENAGSDKSQRQIINVTFRGGQAAGGYRICNCLWGALCAVLDEPTSGLDHKHMLEDLQEVLRGSVGYRNFGLCDHT